MIFFKIGKLTFLIVILFLATSLSTFGQSKKGIIQGKVSDLESKQPIPSAQIFLYRNFSEPPFSGTLSDLLGNFQLGNINPGIYLITSSCLGLEDDTLGPFIVTADTVINLQIQLDLDVGRSAKQAQRDIGNGIIQIYLVGWPMYSKEEADLAKSYGFKIGADGCFPMDDSRYNQFVINYLKKRNGDYWYDKFLEEWKNLQQEQLDKTKKN